MSKILTQTYFFDCLVKRQSRWHDFILCVVSALLSTKRSPRIKKDENVIDVLVEYFATCSVTRVSLGSDNVIYYNSMSIEGFTVLGSDKLLISVPSPLVKWEHTYCEETGRMVGLAVFQKICCIVFSESWTKKNTRLKGDGEILENYTKAMVMLDCVINDVEKRDPVIAKMMRAKAFAYAYSGVKIDPFAEQSLFDHVYSHTVTVHTLLTSGKSYACHLKEDVFVSDRSFDRTTGKMKKHFDKLSMLRNLCVVDFNEMFRNSDAHFVCVFSRTCGYYYGSEVCSRFVYEWLSRGYVLDLDLIKLSRSVYLEFAWDTSYVPVVYRHREIILLIAAFKFAFMMLYDDVWKIDLVIQMVMRCAVKELNGFNVTPIINEAMHRVYEMKTECLDCISSSNEEFMEFYARCILEYLARCERGVA